MIRLAALLLAFASSPGSHTPRAPHRSLPTRRAFFVAEMKRLIPQRALEFNAHETASPAIDSAATRMYVGLSDGRVRCLFHGRTAWIWDAGGSVLAAPLVDGETLYVASASGKLAALNRITGEERWVLDVHEELTTTPTIDQGKLFVMSSEEAVTAVDAATGKSLWKFRREKPAGFTVRGNARPRTGHGFVYAGFADGSVAALRPKDGAPRWVRAVSGTGDYLDVDGLAVPEGDKRVYAASAKAGVVALDAESGEVAWTVALPGANHVLAEGGRLFASGRALILGLDRQTGKMEWSFDLGGEHYATEAGAGDGVLLLAEDRGPLLALDTATGRARTVLDPGSNFSAGPLVVPGAAFIVSNTGALFSLGLLP
ncbi:MAG TPA: PQQ-binding-like beta-propeller repeat protein [Myxococcales bacterium]|jgi:outer membrane protein assembly factor BamB|nr:PQQ-binding-like beta-propeller repeat protein [Myxococcales bacterium]